jgi:ABC-2 type transport system ATP-binding protein
MSDDPALELQGVSKRFGEFLALQGVDLRVERGQVFGFLGPNGAGKTTTLRLVTGLMRPTSGSIHVCGHDVVRDSEAARHQIGFISDRPYLYEKLTGAEFLRFTGGLWGMRPRAIADASARWLERFDLLSWAGESIEAYSHGMRQRLLLCSALIHAPALLIMDEPMVGLDPRGARKLKQVVRELAAGGTTVVLSTHTLDVVEEVCDAVGIIDRGRVMASGALQEVRRAHHAEAARLEELFLQLTGEEDAAGEGGEPPRRQKESAGAGAR